jgi:hypothetical protein
LHDDLARNALSSASIVEKNMATILSINTQATPTQRRPHNDGHSIGW